jgi:hypothetical protein
MAVPAVSAWGKTGIRHHTQPKINKGSTSTSLMSSADQRSTLGLHSLERYEPLIGAATAERILRKWIAFTRLDRTCQFDVPCRRRYRNSDAAVVDDGCDRHRLARCKEVAFENDAFTSILISLVRKFAPANNWIVKVTAHVGASRSGINSTYQRDRVRNRTEMLNFDLAYIWRVRCVSMVRPA